MDFRLSPDEETLRKTVEEFVRERLIPLEPQFEDAPDIFEGSRWKSRARLSRDPVVGRYIEIMENLEKQAEAQGLWHLDVPKEYGAMQVSNVAMLAVTGALEKSASPFDLGDHVSHLLYNSKVQDVDASLWPCSRSEQPSAFGLTEPASGADPSMLQTTALPDGDHFVINGRTMFPTFAGVA